MQGKANHTCATLVTNWIVYGMFFCQRIHWRWPRGHSRHFCHTEEKTAPFGETALFAPKVSVTLVKVNRTLLHCCCDCITVYFKMWELLTVFINTTLETWLPQEINRLWGKNLSSIFLIDCYFPLQTTRLYERTYFMPLPLYYRGSSSLGS